jgi:hypothetical protein
MELSELTNRELKNILRQNNVKNFSKLNKKELIKKVNKLIKVKNGGNQNKKYTFKNLSGGENGETPAESTTKPSNPSSLGSAISNLKNKLPTGLSNPSSLSSAILNLKNKLPTEAKAAITSNPQPSAPPLNAVNEKKLSNQEFNRQTELTKEQSLKNNPNSTQNPNTNPKKEECGPCSIL